MGYLSPPDKKMAGAKAPAMSLHQPMMRAS
jgi:hypothetical protein